MTRTRTGIAALLVLLSGCEGDTPTVVPAAPARVEDLRVDRPIDTTLRLLWTSPPVEALHPAPVRYEIRYAAAPLADAAAIAAAAAVFAPAGRPAGETEIVVLGGLDRSRQYELVLRGQGAAGAWSDWSNVARAATENALPVAVIRVDLGALAGGETVLDAAQSSDLEDGHALEYRWDLENDGAWDSDWSRLPMFTHVFREPGTAPVALQVRDSAGATADTTQVVTIQRIRYRMQRNQVSTRVRSQCCYTFPRCIACDSTRTLAAKDAGPFSGDISIQIPSGLTAATQRFTPAQADITSRFSGYASGSAAGNFWSAAAAHVEFEIASGYTFAFQATRDAVGGTQSTWHVALRSGPVTWFEFDDACCDGGSYAASGTLVPGIYSFDWNSEMTSGSFGTVMVLRFGALPGAGAEVTR